MSFKLDAKNFAFTYSQCPASQTYVLEKLKEIFSVEKVIYIQVSRELHEDGNHHLHALVCLSGRKQVTDALFADILWEGGTYHPNFKKAWKIEGWKDYIDKECMDIAAYGVYTDALKKGRPEKEKLNFKVARKISEGMTVEQLMKKQKYGGYLISNLSKVKYFAAQMAMLKRTDLLPWKKTKSSLSSQDSKILRWIALNLFEEERPLRTPQLYLVSPPGCGKTTLALDLAKSVKTYFPSLGEKYFDGLTEDHQLLIFDEFHGGHPLGLMNQILDGQNCILPQRYQCFTKVKNTPVIIMSNLQPYDCYRKCDTVRVSAFCDRLLVVNVDSFIDIFEN